MRRVKQVAVQVLIVGGFLALSVLYPLEEALSSNEIQFVQDYAEYVSFTGPSRTFE